MLGDTTVKDEFEMDPVAASERERLLEADKQNVDLSPRMSASNRV